MPTTSQMQETDLHHRKQLLEEREEEIMRYWLEDIQRAVMKTHNEKTDFIPDHLTGDAFEEVWHWCRLDITT